MLTLTREVISTPEIIPTLGRYVIVKCSDMQISSKPYFTDIFYVIVLHLVSVKFNLIFMLF